MMRSHVLALSFAVALLAASLNPQRAQGAVASRYVDGPWGHIHINVAGSEHDPTVVLLHQLIWSSDQFRSAQAELAVRGIRSIAVDIPGYGASSGPAAPPALADYVAALVPVVGQFGRASLLGINEGGTIAAAFADAHPDMVQSLVLEGPMILTAVARERYFTQPRAFRPPRADGGHLDAYWRADAERVGDKMSAAARQSRFISVNAAGERGWFAQDLAYAYDLAPVLARVKVPIMLLTYPGQPFHQAALSLKAARPAIALEMLAWDGLTASFDRPDQWAERVATYLKTAR